MSQLEKTVINELKTESNSRINILKERLKNEFSEDDKFYNKVCVYACGSIGRLEMASNSDLDLFFIIMQRGGGEGPLSTNIEKYNFFFKTSLYK